MDGLAPHRVDDRANGLQRDLARGQALLFQGMLSADQSRKDAQQAAMNGSIEHDLAMMAQAMAAVRIQARFRLRLKRLRRERAEQAAAELVAAPVLQRVARMRMERGRYVEQKAALRMQAAWRSKQTRIWKLPKARAEARIRDEEREVREKKEAKEREKAIVMAKWEQYQKRLEALEAPKTGKDAIKRNVSAKKKGGGAKKKPVGAKKPAGAGKKVAAKKPATKK